MCKYILKHLYGGQSPLREEEQRKPPSWKGAPAQWAALSTPGVQPPGTNERPSLQADGRERACKGCLAKYKSDFRRRAQSQTTPIQAKRSSADDGGSPSKEIV